MNQPSRYVNEKEIRPFVIEELRDYRVLKVKFKNIQERTEFRAELMFPELRKSTQDEIRYKQLKRAFEEALDEDEQRVLEAKYMSGKELNNDYLATILGMKPGKFYRKRKTGIINFAKALNMI
ncbi:ArpU family transcriptional regulator [Bacillus sp. 1663tsa1]|uniref:ArpU family transcriptional regulator n=1 Tax=Bacillus sp. 1663tsa1 TaxID=2953804 RepID=UPI00209FC543|nr:ArpU family transcriptional regulator [Bacillus sp. 1663tsa1]MCP1176217.1 ArpU family transcriptional regulator [Bacillus sp. 1663tsa1]